jgi:hypothetical protein
MGYKGMARLNRFNRSSAAIEQMRKSDNDITDVFNSVMDKKPKDISQLAYALYCYDNETHKLFDFLKDKMSIKISYTRSDLEELKGQTQNALGFFIPSRNELYMRLDTQTSNALKSRAEQIGVDTIKSFQITFIHESIHAFHNNLNSGNRLLIEDKLIMLAGEILRANIKTDKKYYDHYKSILRNVVNGSQTPQEVATYWLTSPDLKDILFDFNEKIYDIYDGSIDSEFEIIEPFLPTDKTKENMVQIPEQNNFINDAFFKANPSKVLGDIIPTTNQFGQLYNSVQGNIDIEIEKIDVLIDRKSVV